MTTKFERFHAYIDEQGLKSTKQRDDIAVWFFSTKGHISVDDIHAKVKRINSHIGLSTVYRTMRLLCDAGLVHERHFGDGEALYENVVSHHDHCICTSCGKIIEFENPRIEELQDAVASRFGFELHSHKMELYGLCKACQSSRHS
ncbi:MAG: transcriptional repressor [Deltaproteobacteria bacterium]